MTPSGSEKQLKEFYLRQSPRLIAFARKFVDNLTAEDIVHDVFLKFWNRYPDNFDEDRIGTYLFRMVQNTCFDYLRHVKIEENYIMKVWSELKLEELEWADSYENRSFLEEKIEIIYASIDELPPKCKEIFTKAYLIP